ncbi:MAG: hypothetical protein LBV74_10855 [Tannerella sp.]|jgi:uncharacterized protein YneR|nr:hypothetical protein [Tannerella sp.]
MKKINLLFVFVFVCGLFAVQDGFSQSMYWQDGKIIATQDGKNGIKVSASTFQLKNKHLLEFKDGQLREDLRQGYYTEEMDKISYYSDEEIYVGYYVPSKGHYYSVSKGGGKETLAAYIKDGNIYNIDNTLVYKYDKDFAPVFMGFILFFFLGYTA